MTGRYSHCVTIPTGPQWYAKDLHLFHQQSVDHILEVDLEVEVDFDFDSDCLS